MTKAATATSPAEVDISRNSGGMKLNLKLLWGYKVAESRMAGVRLKTGILKGDATVESTALNGATSTEDVTPGSSLDFDLFYESMGNESCVWGVTLGMSQEGEEKTKDQNGNESKDNKSSAMNLGVYGRNAMGSGHLLWDFTYSMVQENDAAEAGNFDTDGGSGMSLGIGWRMAL